MSRREDVVSFLYRHFGGYFPEGVMSFKYGGGTYSVSNLTENSLAYGPNKYTLTRQSQYSCANFTVRRTLLGPRVMFNLVNWDD